MSIEKFNKSEKINSTQTPVLTKFVVLMQKLFLFLIKHKKITGTIVVIFILIVGYNSLFTKKSTKDQINIKTITAQIDKSFDFPALNNNGKPTGSKIKLKITNVEKTSQVVVKDQVYTAKNNKMFLIVNLELKNDSTSSQNILPGDLLRLSIASNEDNKFAPDLHNNLVPISAISTKIDRVGFVIPMDVKDFKLFVGEIEGKKESVLINFPS
jgi:hypothetical protein